jgi:hypothetical protein
LALSFEGRLAGHISFAWEMYAPSACASCDSDCSCLQYPHSGQYRTVQNMQHQHSLESRKEEAQKQYEQMLLSREREAQRERERERERERLLQEQEEQQQQQQQQQQQWEMDQKRLREQAERRRAKEKEERERREREQQQQQQQHRQAQVEVGFLTILTKICNKISRAIGHAGCYSCGPERTKSEAKNTHTVAIQMFHVMDLTLWVRRRALFVGRRNTRTRRVSMWSMHSGPSRSCLWSTGSPRRGWHRRLSLCKPEVRSAGASPSA